jgi:hypothetical protein
MPKALPRACWLISRSCRCSRIRAPIYAPTAVALLACFGFSFFHVGSDVTAQNAAFPVCSTTRVKSAIVLSLMVDGLAGLPDFWQVSTGQDGQQAGCHTSSEPLPLVGSATSARVPEAGSLERSPTCSILYIRTEPTPRLCVMFSAGQHGGTSVIGSDYFTRQAATLLKFAKATTNPQLAAVLIEKAADLKSQLDESSTTPEPSTLAPAVGPERQVPEP